MLHLFIHKLRKLLGNTPQELSLSKSLASLLGFKPRNIEYYELAFTHSSLGLEDSEGRHVDNERLEFLGDSVLATAMSHYLYYRHPDWQEGELSKRRGAVVKRAVNNAVSERMGLPQYLRVKTDQAQTNLGPDTAGNTLEALIGAIFLDQGYDVAERFVVRRFIPLFKDLESSLLDQTTNYKSDLLEWAQKHHFSVEFRMLQIPKKSGATFMAGVYVNDRRVSIGSGLNKKEAHQAAAHAALEILTKLEDLPEQEGVDR